MNDKSMPSTATSEVKLTGVGHDPRTGTVYLRYEFTNVFGEKVTILFAPGKHSSRDRALVQQLVRAGFSLPMGARAINDFIVDLDAQTTTNRFIVASQFGWLENEQVFCTPETTYGIPTTPLETDFADIATNHKFGRKGTLARWQKRVARRACGNRLLMFALSAAFAGPLLKPLNIESGGFQLVASSSSGKTTCLSAAVSVWGHGFEQWLMTANALDPLGVRYSDTLLPLDEAGLAPGSAKQILESCYRLCGGSEKLRATDTSTSRVFRLIFMSTAENPTTHLATREGAAWDPGQLVRFIDIDADGGKGMGVFEKLHGIASPAQFADHLKEAVQGQHGTAGPAYLERLVDDLAKDRRGRLAWLKKRMASYQRRAPELDLGRFHDRIAKRFALVYAAGALAIEYGVLPFTRNELLKAVRYCHAQAVVGALATFAKPVVSGVELVRSFLTQRELEFRDLKAALRADPISTAFAPGFVAYKGSESEYLIEYEFFRDVVCAGHDCNKVLNELRARGYLNLNKGGKRTVSRTMPTALDPKRQRVISISGRLLAEYRC